MKGGYFMRRITTLEPASAEATNLADQLTRLIQEGSIVFEDRLLPERILAEQVGTSRGKLRQAMALLEHRGLIATVPRSGTYVTMSHAGVTGGRETQEETSNCQLMQARLGLEPVAAGLAATGANRSEVLQIFHAMNRVKDRVGMRVSADEADTNFHLTIVKAAHNPYLTGMMMMVEHLIREHYAPIRQRMLQDVTLSHAFLMQHTAIYTAIRRRDAALAEKAARDHIIFSIDSFQGRGIGKGGH